MMSAQPSPHTVSRRSILHLLGAAPLALSGLTSVPGLGKAGAADAEPAGRPAGDLAVTIQDIIDRPQFQGSHWGMNFSRSGAAVRYMR